MFILVDTPTLELECSIKKFNFAFVGNVLYELQQEGLFMMKNNLSLHPLPKWTETHDLYFILVLQFFDVEL